MQDETGIRPPGYRLPEDAQIGRVALQISDLARSVSYYEKVLGLDVRERSDGFAALAPRGGGDVILELREFPGAKLVPRRGLLGLYHFAVLLPDRASLGRFVSHLSEIGTYAGMSDHLVSEAVYLTDPDGLGIEVYADKSRSSWVVDNGQMAMTTKPLDVQSVVAAAAGEKWEGSPAGTRMGHVHFHVGDIDAAAAFYHAGLGLDKIVWSYPGALFMSAGGYHHHVGVNTWAAGSPPASDDDARLLYWELVVPEQSDADSAIRSIEAAGFGVTRSDGITEAVDPWGIRLRLRSEVGATGFSEFLPTR